MKSGWLSVLALLFFVITSTGAVLAASNLDEGIGQLANQITKSMEAQQKQKIAIIDFSDLDGNVTALGQFMAEELTTQLFVIAPGKFEVVERRQLLKLIDELMLGLSGLIEENSIKELGRVAGVDAIVTGSITDLGNTVKVNARLIGVDSAKIFAVAATDIPKTGMVADLIGRKAEKKQAVSQTTKGAKGEARQVPASEQTTEVGGIIIALQECRYSGGNVSCSFVLTNKGNDTKFGLYSNGTRMFDDFGNEYGAVSVNFAVKQGGTEKLLISGIPVKGAIQFDGVSAEATKVALLEISCSGYSVVRFRNIPLMK